MNTFRLFAGLFVVAWGLSILFNFDVFKYLFAAFIIFLGVSILTGQQMFPKSIKATSKESDINKVAVFSELKYESSAENFKSADFVVVFGGGEVDLSRVKTDQKEVTLNFVAIFGGLKVIVPKTWQVKTEGVGIAGAFNNNSKNEGSSVSAKVEGVAIFGGVEIVN